MGRSFFPRLMPDELTFSRITAIYRHEKEHKTLMPLEETFYAQLAAHLEALRADLGKEPTERTRSQVLSEEIAKTERKREQIFAERERKIALLASHRVSGLDVDTKGLAREEREMLEGFVALLTSSRDRAFGRAPPVTPQSPPSTPPHPVVATALTPPAPPLARSLADTSLVRVLQDVPPFAGIQATYRLLRGDVLTMPRSIATLLAQKGKVHEIGALPSAK